MLVKKYAKYLRNLSRDIGNIWGSTQTLTFARLRLREADPGLSRIAPLYIFHIQ
jgi:hypothetical protein